MNNALHHTGLDRVATGIWGLVTAFDHWAVSVPHTRRFQEQQDIREVQNLRKARNQFI